MVSFAALLVSALLVLANAFFVASEFAMVKIRPTQLEQLAREKHVRAALALRIAKNLDAYLSANQLGITLASLALGWLGEPAFADLLRAPLSRLALGETAVHSVAIIAAFVLITFLHTVLGELAPKSLALLRTETVALWTALPLHVFYVVAFPLIWTLNQAARLSLRLLGLRPAKELEGHHEPEELRLILHRVALDAGARKLIDRIFDYTHRVARHVMTLRRDVVVLEKGLSFEENLERMLDHQFSRYPYVDSSSGAVLGYIHVKDVMNLIARGVRRSFDDLLRAPVWAHEETSLETLRQQFLQRGALIAMIRDERGEVSGILTLEDLLEEFVGEIRDEQDSGEVAPIVLTPEGGFEADGRVTLDVAARDLELELDDPLAAIVETLGGYVLARLGRAPVAGDVVEAGRFRLLVLAVRDRRVRRLRGLPLSPPERRKERLPAPATL